MKFAQADFTLEVRQDDGATLKEHLFSAWRQNPNQKPQELKDVPPFPELVRYLWDYYLELHARRRNYGWGHKALEFDELEAWARLTKRHLDPWELKAILAVDNAYIASLAKVKDKP